MLPHDFGGIVKPLSEVTADFDLIASALAETPAERPLTEAELAVLRAIPADARSALDVGCGDGHFARAIAHRGIAVAAIDLAPQMIALAQARTQREHGIEYRVGDVLQTDASAAPYDVVVAINVVHHVPLDHILPRLASFVAPGGTLVIQDVVTRPGLRYLPINLIAGCRSGWRRLMRLDPITRQVRRLYDQHGRGESYLQPHAVAAALTPFLPGVAVEHHLAWRYTAVWCRTRPKPPLEIGR